MPEALRPFLDTLYKTFDRRHLDSDPLAFVHRYRNRGDREVVAFLSAALAFGNVRSIKSSLERLLAVLGPRPKEFVLDFDPASDSEKLPATVHRWIRQDDAARALVVLSKMLRDHGSLEEAFASGDEPSYPTVEPALTAFSSLARRLDPGPLNGQAPPAGRPSGAACFFPSPASGGACKRLNLFLRWMVRGGDGLDLGLWTSQSPSRLLIPLDVHVARIARAVGLTHRKTIGMAMVREVTEKLRRFDPEDPTKYDFAIARLGILDWCPSRRTIGRCEECPLVTVCTL